MSTKLILAASALGLVFLLACFVRTKDGNYGYGKALGYLLTASICYFILDRMLLRFLICRAFFSHATSFTIAWGDNFGYDRLGALKPTLIRMLFSTLAISAIQEVSKFIIWEYKISRSSSQLNEARIRALVLGTSIAAACIDIGLQYSFSVLPFGNSAAFIRINLVGVILKYICIHILSGFVVIAVLKDTLPQCLLKAERIKLLAKAFTYSFIVHAVVTAVFFSLGLVAIGILVVVLVTLVTLYYRQHKGVGHSGFVTSKQKYQSAMRSIVFLIALSGSLLTVGCKKDNHSTPVALVCPISDNDFNSVPPPTFHQLYNAQIDVIAKDSSLVHKEDELFCAVFDWVKRHPDGALKPASLIDDYISAYQAHPLNPEEWKLIRNNPFKGLMAVNSAMDADEAAFNTYPCDIEEKFYNTKADAYHHAAWSMMMAKACTQDFAFTFGNAHELSSTDSAQTAMDLHNNKVGRDLVARYPNATEKELLIILAQQKYVFLANPYAPILNMYDNDLVYFNGKREYDGIFGGTITNPDSGEPWNIFFYLNQCGTLMRGKFIILRGNERQDRRFSGTLNPSGTMELAVSDPYVYENPSGSFCSGFQMHLSASPDDLTGNWTSTNCGQGGTIHMWR